ncbi:MFS transporter [Sphaerisporangium sp. TRM90804]|uniref:MFS transporter n=1 Tax=Sphaerisporangium sp. TRM90804 TaxID=3031113 RepID=UPI00244CD706|nr:MFS transporter [Sphaerisporangium sp. TRM90804]MDH2424637.1 MFS transporter [Sphaerisporangium sp. TRM90804]
MHQPTGHPRRWQILGVMVFSLLAIVLDNTILNVALKVISDPEAGLGATQGQLEWAINSYTLVFAGLLFTFGVLGDRFGRKRMLQVGMILFGLSSLASAYAQDPAQLIVARAAMGFGAAAVMPATLAIISNVFSPQERGKAIGIWAGGVGLAVAIGPIIGGLLLEHFWWGSVFLVNVPVVIVSSLLIAFLVPESKSADRSGLDPVGVLLSIVGMVGLVYGVIRGGELGTIADPEVWAPALVGVAVLAAFVRHERRTPHPAFDVRYFALPRFSTAVASIGLVFFAMMGVMFFLAFYLQIVKGFSPLMAGVLLLPFAAAQLVFSPLSTGMVKRFGAKLVATVSMLLIAATLVGYAFIQVDTPIWAFLLIMFVQGVAMASIGAPATEAVMSSLPREKAGVGSAMTNTIRQIGGALGVAILGSILSATYRDNISGSLTALPEGVRHEAGESITATMGAAQQLGAQGASLIEPAKQAFMDGMHVSAVVGAAVALLGAAVVARWLPGREKAAPPVRQPDHKEPAVV